MALESPIPGLTAREPLTQDQLQAAEKRLLMACRRVTWQRIFFGVALAYCRIRLGNVGTAAVSKYGDMWFDPRFMETISDDELEAVICHEISHLIYRHDAREGNREHRRWNRAADRAINAILREAGLNLPKDCLYPLESDHERLCAEDLYDFEPEPEEGEGGGSGGEGPGSGPPAPGTGCGPIDAPPGGGKGEGDDGDGKGDGSSPNKERYVGQAEGPDWGAIAVQCASVAAQGDGSGAALRRLTEAPPSHVRWEQVLRHALNRAALAHGRDDVSFARRSRRTQIGGVVFPGCTSYKAQIAVTVDTSGSMGEKAIALAIGHCRAIGKALGVGIFLVGHTCRAYLAEWVTPGMSVDAYADKLNESGGTSFDDAFRKIEKSSGKFDYLVQLTDGEAQWPELPTNCRKTIVALVGMRCREYVPANAEVIDTEV